MPRSHPVGLRAVLVAFSVCLSCLAVASEPVADADVDLTLVPDQFGRMTNSVGMKFVRIRAGKFMMGAPDDEANAEQHEKPRHQVTLTKDYHLGVYEVTQKQYKQIMGKNPSYFSKDGGGADSVKGLDTDDFPVGNVSLNTARKFIEKLNALPAERLSGRTYRLPTEAEWEYACRGGTDVKEPFTFDKPSASISSDDANMDGTQPYGGGKAGKILDRPCKVGSYKANPFGLYDMHGNLWEMCQDRFDPKAYQGKDRKDPTGPAKAMSHVIRGGCYFNPGMECRSAVRFENSDDFAANNVGLRLACDVRPK